MARYIIRFHVHCEMEEQWVGIHPTFHAEIACIVNAGSLVIYGIKRRSWYGGSCRHFGHHALFGSSTRYLIKEEYKDSSKLIYIGWCRIWSKNIDFWHQWQALARIGFEHTAVSRRNLVWRAACERRGVMHKGGQTTWSMERWNGRPFHVPIVSA
jgi:hypothetical protein